MQVLWELFAEDLGLVQGDPLGRLAFELSRDPSRGSSVEISDLFRRLDERDPTEKNLGRYLSLPYVNGELFSQQLRNHLQPKELQIIFDCAQFDWRKVNPTIFGTIFEGVMALEKRGISVRGIRRT